MSRLRLLILALLVTLSGGSFASPLLAERTLQRRPNIILLVVDDQRWDTLGCMGNPIVQTPHIDSLAADGVVFDQFFCTTSICATSRASILSGQYARRHGIHGFREMFSEDAFDDTFAGRLRAAGYRTGFVGKWGIGQAADLPKDRYDYWDGFPGQGRYFEVDKTHLTGRLTQSAVKFLQSCTDEHPFCLQLNYKAAHCQDGADWQFQHDLAYRDLYKDKTMPEPATGTQAHFETLPDFLQTSEARRRWQVRFADPKMHQKTVKDYYRLLTGVDDSVGRIMQQLKSQKLADNTVVIYTSDNGFYLGDYGLAGKWFMHDPSIRLPFVVFDPRLPAAKRGRRVEQLCLTIDIAPTILSLAGLAPPKSMQGADMTSLIAGETTPSWRVDFFYEHLFEHARIPKSEGVRSNHFKLVRYLDPSHEALYDLRNDPHEEVNVIDRPQYKPLANTMRARLDEWVVNAANDDERTPMTAQPLAYPKTRYTDHVDTYHGVRVADPYRWLEDPDSKATEAWVKAQNKVTFSYLVKLPLRKPFEERLTKLWNYERFGSPRKRENRYFFTRNDGLQNQSVLFVSEGLDGEPRQLLDPNKLSEDGTVALAGWAPSETGRLLAYGLAASGSDWREWKVMDVATGKTLDDHLKWVKFSGVSWTPDEKGFFYSRYDEPEEGEEFTGAVYYQKLYYHRIGDPQSKDTLIYERPDEKEWGFGGSVTEKGDYLIISVWRGTENNNQIFYRDLSKDAAPVVELLAGFDAEYRFTGNDGPVFYFVTDNDAAKRRLIALDVRKPEKANWREIVPEADSVIEGVSYTGGQFFVNYLQDAQNRVLRYAVDGKPLGEVELPAIGSAGGFGGRSDATETFYGFTNFTTPSTIYRYDIATGKSEVYKQPKVDFDPDRYETTQVFYRSKDGAKIPMFITHRKGMPRDGTAPTILYGYGGFDISLTPSFSVNNIAWLEKGGVYAMPNLRGGGEYGREWHEAGMLDRKQNVFDDFIAAAEYLIAEKYTSSDHLAIRGRSNGGLLVGACMTQRPDLFAAASPGVGVLDMLRFHKFTIGWAWVNEYGSSDDAEQFKTLLAYSPLHNLSKGTKYPSTIVMTADHDDRVVPAHSFKFAAALQAAHAGDNPVLIRIESSAGHGAGTPTKKRIEAAADELAFLANELGLKPE